jgi:hypothetical protein
MAFGGSLGGRRDAQVMASNTGTNPVVAEVYLDYQGLHHAVQPLTFAPNETKVLDINQMLAGLGVDPAQAPSGGITIIGQSPNPALIASGRITDSATGFSSTIDFPDPQLQRASALHASGLPMTALAVPALPATSILSCSPGVLTFLWPASRS